MPDGALRQVADRTCCPTRSWNAAYTSDLTSSCSVCGMSSIQPWRRMSQNSTGVRSSRP